MHVDLVHTFTTIQVGQALMHYVGRVIESKVEFIVQLTINPADCNDNKAGCATCAGYKSKLVSDCQHVEAVKRAYFQYVIQGKQTISRAGVYIEVEELEVVEQTFVPGTDWGD